MLICTRDHLNEDIEPYVCLSEECMSPLLFFAHMNQWVEHMNSSHSKQWNTTIHMSTWYCDTDHQLSQFNELESFIDHMRDPTNHPGRPLPGIAQLATLSRTHQKALIREDRYSCPFCDCIPEALTPLIPTSEPDELLYKLHQHIASHIKDLAILSIPLQAADGIAISLFSESEEEESHDQLKTDEKASYPSGYDDLRTMQIFEDVDKPEIPSIYVEETQTTYWHDIGFEDWLEEQYKIKLSKLEIDSVLQQFIRARVQSSNRVQSWSSEIAELFEKDLISPEDMQNHLNMLKEHYFTGDDYDKDFLAAFASRQVMCLIMGCLKDATGMKEWLRTNHQNKTMFDRDLPLPRRKMEGLSSDEQEKFIELQQKLCGPYEMGEHSDVISPMLPPFYTYGNPLGKGTYAIVEAVEPVHHIGEQKPIRYARKRSLADKSESVLKDELKTFTRMGFHHHVVRFVGSYSHKGRMNIILSPLADCNLFEYLEDDMTPLKEEVLMQAFGCLLSGLGFLSAKIRHKDIKPQNILIDDSRILFTDFGSAYVFEKGVAATSRTSPGLINTMYAAPEVFKREQRDVKTDLFSLGCVFAEIIAVLSGMKIAEFHKKMQGTKGEGSDIRYSDMVSALHKWLDEVKETNPELSIPIGWCRDMTQRVRIRRPKITALIQQAKKQCKSLGVLEAYFCRDCLTEPPGTL